MTHQGSSKAAARPSLAAALALTVLVATAAQAAQAARVEIEDRPIAVPINDNTGHVRKMLGHVCIPQDTESPQLVIINHGSPAQASQRPALTATSCGSEVAEWFTSRGYAVMFVLRLGYGATGGPWTETFGTCEDADYYHAGLESARQYQAMVSYAQKLDGIDADDVIVVGHSAGGWGTLAYNSIAHPHVAAFINMAAGRGGYQGGPNITCHAERLVEAARRYGRGATDPMLWVYARNDQFFGPALAQQIYAAYHEGEAEIAFKPVGNFGEDGHQLFFSRGGSRIWGPLVEEFLAAQSDGGDTD